MEMRVVWWRFGCGEGGTPSLAFFVAEENKR